MKKIVIIVLTLVTMLVFTSCGISAKSNSDTNNEETFKSSEEEKSDDTKEDKDTENKEAGSPLSKAEQLLENMTLEEKVGQLFIVRPDALNPNLTEEQIGDINSGGAISLDDQMKEMMNRYHVGGVAMRICSKKVKFHYLLELMRKAELFQELQALQGLMFHKLELWSKLVLQVTVKMQKMLDLP